MHPRDVVDDAEHAAGERGRAQPERWPPRRERRAERRDENDRGKVRELAPTFGRIGRRWLQQREAVVAAASCVLCAGGAWTTRAKRAKASVTTADAEAAAAASAARRAGLGDGLATQDLARAFSPTSLALTTGALAAVGVLRAASARWMMADFEDLGDPVQKPGEFDDDGSDVLASDSAEVLG